MHGVGTPRALAPEGERTHRRAAAADRDEQLGAEGVPHGRHRPSAAVVPLVAGEDLAALDAVRQRRRQRELHGPALALPRPHEPAAAFPLKRRGRGGADRGRQDGVRPADHLAEGVNRDEGVAQLGEGLLGIVALAEEDAVDAVLHAGAHGRDQEEQRQVEDGQRER